MFHARGPAAAKDRSPSDVVVRGTATVLDAADLRQGLTVAAADGVIRSARYKMVRRRTSSDEGGLILLQGLKPERGGGLNLSGSLTLTTGLFTYKCRSKKEVKRRIQKQKCNKRFKCNISRLQSNQ